MENTTVIVNVTKKQGRAGWSIETIVKYPTFTHPALTYSGASSLKHALWANLDPNKYVHDAELLSVNVNGSPLKFETAYSHIERALENGVLHYTLPRYRKFLGIEQGEA